MNTMERLGAAVAAHRATGATGPRDELLALWEETDDVAHRCAIAHHLADMYDDPALALMWDTRALDAARPGTDAGFYPSLHLNLADDLRRLGSFGAAAEHLAAARSHPPAVADDEYVALMRTAFAAVEDAIEHRSTEPLVH